VGRRIGGAGGGSDPGKKGSGGLIVAGALVVALGAGGAGAAGVVGGTGAAGSSAGTLSSGSRSGGKARDADTITARLTARGIRAVAHLDDDSADCVDHSYGQVRDYLLEHPCRRLLRSVIEVRDSRGDVALIAVASVEMPDEQQADGLKSLMDEPGGGNITELSREQGKYRTVRFTGYAYDSRQDGTVVTNAQVQPVARGWTGLAFTTLATQAVS
jgi:hypothetical protein